jgi:CheY-like chemotaxis protein
LQKYNYLIVEDHAFQRTLLEQLVRTLGADAVHVASNGAEARRILRDAPTPVDIVVSDLMMPTVDGIELLPALKQSTPQPALVLVSADPNVLAAADAIAQAHGIMVLGTIEKPITQAKLKLLLERYATSRGS